MGSTVSDSSGTPENGREREGERERERERERSREQEQEQEQERERERSREQAQMPVRAWGPDRVKAHDGAGGPGSVSGPGSANGVGPGSASSSGSVSGPGSANGVGQGSDSGSGSGNGVGPGAGPGFASGVEPGAGPESVVDLVLDLVPGEDMDSATLGAASASVSVPAAVPGTATVPDPVPDVVPVPVAAPGTAPVQDPVPDVVAPVSALAGHRTGSGSDARPPSPPPPPPPPPSPPSHPVAPDAVFDSLPVAGGDGAGQAGDAPWGARRHHSVIANEQTATIPVHLLFREDPEDTDAAALPAGVVRRGTGADQPAAGVRRPSVPKGPQVQPSTRPAPVGDPWLAERSGPALPAWVALLAGPAGIAAGGAVLWWVGALPAAALARFGIGARPYDGIGLGAWAALAALVTAVLFALGGLSRGRVGYAWVLTLFGEYRGSVRRTGLMWISPLLLRRRVDVRLRHWRSEPLPAVDANGTALRVVVLVVWRIKDTARAALGVADHEAYLREQVEAAMARVLSQLPADAFHEDAHTLRNAEAVGDALTRMLKADCEPVGIEVYSAQPTGIEYAPEIAAAMQRRRIAAIDAKHRDSVLTSVVDAVDDTVNRLTARGLVELDDYERKSLVKDLTVAFYTGRSGGEGA
ncbi:SPFH domain-containing protein [Streptomyces sp. NPDC051644]|uniref:SPFH domain-containing protein n=1 Tax=Streptomyces sp. NPDC051644 TaxID=3365666 RepID=UPI0037873F89